MPRTIALALFSTREIGGQTGKTVNNQVAIVGFHFGQYFFDHSAAFFNREHRIFFGIIQNGDDDFVKQRRAAFDYIEMTVG
jgi:hypothetical protein